MQPPNMNCDFSLKKQVSCKILSRRKVPGYQSLLAKKKSAGAVILNSVRIRLQRILQCILTLQGERKAIFPNYARGFPLYEMRLN